MFKIRKYAEGDEISILKLDRLVETHKWNRRNLKNWIWKYKGKNPSGKNPYGKKRTLARWGTGEVAVLLSSGERIWDKKPFSNVRRDVQ